MAKGFTKKIYSITQNWQKIQLNKSELYQAKYLRKFRTKIYNITECKKKEKTFSESRKNA